MRRRDWLMSAGLAGAVPLQAQPAQSAANSDRRVKMLSPRERREGFHRNLVARGEAIAQNQFRGIKTREEWEKSRPQFLRDFLWELGLPEGPRTEPLHARVTGGFERNGYRVENIVFESSPGLYVTGNLYLPAARVQGGAPVVVYVCGHSPSPLGAKIAYQHHALWFVKHGFAAFVLDTIEFAEIAGIHHGTHDLEWWHWLSLGYNPTAVEVWNAMRALDYLETRPEVNARRASITGRSGGGAVSWFAAAADERFQVASPVHGTWAVAPHIRDYTVRENCDCIYVWNSELLDLPSIGALIAPRPLLIVNGRRDPCFPPAGYREVENRLREVYRWYGAEEKLASFEADTGHEDTPAYREAANLWISQWITGSRPAYSEADITREPDPSVLRVLDAIPTDARNEGIDREFIPAVSAPRNSLLSEWQARKTALREALTAKVLRGLAPRTAPFNTQKAALQNWTERYCQASSVQFETEPGMTVNGQLFVPRPPTALQGALIYLKDRDDLVYGIDYDDILALLPGYAVLVLRPRGVDYGLNNPEMAEVKMSAALLGTTLETLQLHDVLRTVDFLIEDQQLPVQSVSIFGRKAMAMVAIYAGAVEERVSRVVLDRPPESHWDGPAMMHALRYTDIPEVAALIAPREVVFLGRTPAAYRATETLAGLFPGGKPVRRANSLGDAMRGSGSV
ncbi:MAG: acetylxylan esterase [Bryobacterales bacterium]|nr:acetylxylan esterase [Bryobacterales bacterium]